MKFRSIALCCAGLLCSIANATTDASSLKLQVYSVMLSTSPQCTSPVTVFSNTTPTEVDFLVAPTLGSGNPPDGTYPCIIIKMSDTIKFTPTTNDGSCTGNQQYTTDVCQTGESTRAPDAVGSANACSTGAPDLVYLYLTTGRIGSGGGNAFLQPLAPNNTTYGVNLTSPLVVSGTATAKIVVTAKNAVDGSGPSCGMNAPVFGFKIP
jgi:hypothetical protein